MITVVVQTNVSNARGYFSQHLTRNDYYSAQEIHPGQWIGHGTDRLGLASGSEVTCDAFESLCENHHPQTGERLTLRQNEQGQRRIFYDFTCSAPKSVSVLAVTMNDDRLLSAHEVAVGMAFRELERFAATRVRKRGQQDDRVTDNLVAARFTHSTSRALDPQLHTHCTVFNATFDPVEQSWKALQAGGMYDAIRFGTEVYRNELARGILALGYRIVPAAHGFEIAGVDGGILQRFSKRAAQRDAVIREMEARLGRSLSKNEVSYAVHQSRAKKLQCLSAAEVRERQVAQLSIEEAKTLGSIVRAASGQAAVIEQRGEVAAVEHAITHAFERRSVVPEHELLEHALAFGRGQVSVPALTDTLRRTEGLIATDKGYSTRGILLSELSLIETVREGKGSASPLNHDYRPADWLSSDQRTALLQVLGSVDRVTGFRGLAGTGKTTVLRELETACKQAGHTLRFCAPTSAAADVLRREGFDAVTLEALLRANPVQGAARTAIVLDEAGAVGVEDMNRLLRLGGRVILAGDTGQHGSVKWGDALRLIEEHSPYTFGQLTQIRRQRRSDYRRIVELAATQQTTRAFAELERLGVVEERSGDDVHSAAARAYAKASGDGQSALLVAPTWAEIESVTKQVRKELKASGRLEAVEKEFRVFDSLSWTEAQKRDIRQYRVGQVLRFHQGGSGFRRDESVEVEAVADEQLRVRRGNGLVTSFRPGDSRCRFEVGETKALPVAAGDRLLLQGNRGKQFVNGELVEVKTIRDGRIQLADGRSIPADYNTFTHGYAVTSHGAQGKTVDAVFMVASAKSLSAVHRQQFYVSISRGRDVCRVFTDDKDSLRRHVIDSSDRLAAIEAVRSEPRSRLRKLIHQVGHRIASTLQRVRLAVQPMHSMAPSIQEIPSPQRSRGIRI